MSVADFVNIPALIGGAVGATIFGWLGAYVAIKGRNDRMWISFARTYGQTPRS